MPDKQAAIALLRTIPADLRERDQWVVWRYETRDTKPTKVPYQCWIKQQKKASSTDPNTWGGFGAAITAYEHGPYDGVGFVLSKGDPFVFIDLDHCRDAEKGIIDGPAIEIIKTLHGYAELSPSGTGVHIFVCGVLPEGRRKVGQVEMYDRARFATMTGQRLELPE